MKKHLISACIFSALLLSWHVYSVAYKNEAITPLPAKLEANAKSEIGRKLFLYKRLSSTNTFSCASCHQPSKGFSQPFSGRVQTISLINVSFNDQFFWNGRVGSLREALKISLYDPAMMGNDKDELLERLNEDSALVKEFNAAFDDGLTEETLIDALEHYLKTLTSPNSRFDKYLAGDTGAITVKERKGYELFQNYGCISCHQGVNVGGNIMQKFGVYSEPLKNPEGYDLGYYQITQDENDKGVFRVPSLRNVAISRPYFHNGMARNLYQAIEIMGQTQLNQKIPKRDIELIEQFLKTLTGEWESD